MKYIILLIFLVSCSSSNFVYYDVNVNDPKEYILDRETGEVYKRSHKYDYADSIYKEISKGELK